MICDEHMLFEGRFYTVMRCGRGYEEYTDIEYEYGKLLIERKDPVLKEYLLYKTAELDKILCVHKGAEIIQKKDMCEEVLGCL
jgi:tRNA (adenine22-N1)-methyltransferase